MPFVSLITKSILVHFTHPESCFYLYCAFTLLELVHLLTKTLFGLIVRVCDWSTAVCSFLLWWPFSIIEFIAKTRFFLDWADPTVWSASQLATALPRIHLSFLSAQILRTETVGSFAGFGWRLCLFLISSYCKPLLLYFELSSWSHSMQRWLQHFKQRL